tara:strand:+ start:253 stop:483 length:231 start_codon:yes stop_codon:yes gene_type:complete
MNNRQKTINALDANPAETKAAIERFLKRRGYDLFTDDELIEILTDAGQKMRRDGQFGAASRAHYVNLQRASEQSHA